MTANDSATYEWTVSGMDCASCAGKVRGAVERLPGVSDVDVALMTERLRPTLDRQGPRAVPVPVRVGIRPRRADW